jgi:hypothetical protein
MPRWLGWIARLARLDAASSSIAPPRPDACSPELGLHLVRDESRRDRPARESRQPPDAGLVESREAPRSTLIPPTRRRGPPRVNRPDGSPARTTAPVSLPVAISAPRLPIC